MLNFTPSELKLVDVEDRLNKLARWQNLCIRHFQVENL